MDNKQKTVKLFVGGFKKKITNHTQVKKIRQILKVPVKKILFPLVAVSRIIRPRIIELAAFAGSGTHSRQSLNVSFGLPKQHRHAWLNMVFDEVLTCSEEQNIRLKDVFRGKSVENKTDITVVFVDHNDFDCEADNTWFFIPEWVYGQIALPMGEKYLRRETIKSDLRNIRKYGFQYDISDDPAVFDNFYFNMHIPYITKVHGDFAFFDTRVEQHKKDKDYDLLLIKTSGNPDYIAGIVIIYELDEAKLWMLGVRQDGNDYVRQGIIAALYHFSFEYLQAKGFDQVGTGGAKAFLNDGIFKFKRKMSQAIVRGARNGFALKIHHLTPAVQTFLVKNPFVFKKNSTLYIAVFIESAVILTDEYFRLLYKNYFQEGLSSIVVYCIEKNDQGCTVPEDIAGYFSVRSVSDLLASNEKNLNDSR